MKSEVQHFESDGIPCITPDYIAEYIIQVTCLRTIYIHSTAFIFTKQLELAVK